MCDSELEISNFKRLSVVALIWNSIRRAAARRREISILSNRLAANKLIIKFAFIEYQYAYDSIAILEIYTTTWLTKNVKNYRFLLKAIFNMI